MAVIVLPGTGSQMARRAAIVNGSVPDSIHRRKNNVAMRHGQALARHGARAWLNGSNGKPDQIRMPIIHSDTHKAPAASAAWQIPHTSEAHRFGLKRVKLVNRITTLPIGRLAASNTEC